MFRLFLLITGIEGLFAIFKILQSPSEVDSARLLGLSTSRLMMLGGALLLVFFFIGIFLLSLWRRSWFWRFEKRFNYVFSSRKNLFIVLSICALAAYAGGQYALYAQMAEEPVVGAILLRLLPLFVWLLLLSAQFAAMCLIWHNTANRIHSHKNSIFILPIGIFSFSLLGWLWIVRTGYGFSEETRATGYFRVPGTPVIGSQILLAIVIAFSVVWLWEALASKITLTWRVGTLRLDVLVGIILWAVTFSLWMAVPLEPSWFADPPRTPNFTFSPNSDAHMYDEAGQSLLVGSGLWNSHWKAAIRRPMLSGMFALFHFIQGLGYEEIIVLQVALLAFFSVLIYLFTSVLHNRISGVLAAILIIIRERNAILLADKITVSHAKILMSDLPATVGVVFFLLLIYQWLKKPGEHPYLPIVAGGVIGFFVLIRAEIGFLLVFIGLVGFWLLRRTPWAYFRGMALLSIGFVLMVAPWTWRNWRVTGTLYMDTPLNMQRLENVLEDILGREDKLDESSFNHTAYKDAFVLPASKLSSVDQRTGVFSRLKNDEFDKTENFLNHYFNGQTQFVYMLPLSPQILTAAANLAADRTLDGFLLSCCSVEGYVRGLPYWWSDWDGGLARQSYLSMAIVLLVLSIGISVLWKEQNLLSLLPIAAGSFHVFFFAMNRRSGGRWLMEYDWFTFVILSVGLVAIIQGVVNWLRAGAPQIESRFMSDWEYEAKSTWRVGHYLGVAIVIFMVGAALPVSEIIIPPKYTEADVNVLIEKLLDSEQSILSHEEKAEFENLINKDVGIWYGRALYPRYYERDDGMDGWKDHYKHPFSRFEFYSVGTKNGWFVLPYVDDGISFPHAADALVLGCGHEYYLDVMVMVLYPAGSDTPQEILWRDPASGEIEDCFSK